MFTARSIAIGIFIAWSVTWRADAHTPEPAHPEHEPYVAAFAAGEKGKWTKALRLAAKGDEPLLNKVITWLALTRTRRLPPFESFAAFIDENPDWPDITTIRRRAEAVMDATVSDARVFAWFADHPPFTGLGLVRHAEAYLHGGDELAANALLREAWINGNFTYREEKVILARHRKHLRLQDHVTRLDRLLWERRRRPAKRMLRRVDAGHRALAVARLRLMVRAGDVDGAIAGVPEDLRDDPGLWYERLRWRRRRGLDERAREILESPPDELVRPAAWWREAYIQTRNAVSEGLISVAYRLASEHRQTAALPRAQAEWLAGWIALRFLEDPDLAYPHFVTLSAGVRFPISVARAAYWAGRTAEFAGNWARARTWYQRAARHATTFYGQLALAALGRGDHLPLPEEPPIEAEDLQFIETHELTKVVRMLAEHGQHKHLRAFIMRLGELAATPGQHKLVAALARDADRPDLGLAVTRRYAHNGTPLIEDGYPIVPLPPSRSKRYRAEPALVLAMLRQESGFRVDARSHAGARGLMQILPRTAYNVAKRLRIRYSRKRLTTDPEYNLTLGRAYIEGLLRTFDGSYVLALAAYNAGPKRVRRWIEHYGDPRSREVNVIDWLELVPLSETRNYIQRVLEAIPVYRALLGEPGPRQGLAVDLIRGTETPPT